jgi:hypothetical protein
MKTKKPLPGSFPFGGFRLPGFPAYTEAPLFGSMPSIAYRGCCHDSRLVMLGECVM